MKGTDSTSAKDTFRALRAHMSPALALAGKFAGQGAVEVAAEGCEVRLSDGRSVLDFGSYAVPLLGHRNPAVVAAVRDQLDAMPVSTRSLSSPPLARAAREVVEYAGEPRLNRVHFGTNGADAVEVAVKLARVVTGRPTVAAVRGAYHGKTMGALALTSHTRFRNGLEELLGGVVHLDPEDPEAVARALADTPLAAVVFEPVQGENGVVPLPADVLARWCADAKQAGAFVISDEIQVGLRRAGERSVALHAGLPVDALLLGKPLGGGVAAVSAAVLSDELYQPLTDDPFRHTATFAGQPLTMAAVPAALGAIEELTERGAHLAKLMESELGGLKERFPTVLTAVRGQGLIWGADFATPEHAGEVVVGLAERGLLVSPCLSRPETLRLLPPLVAADDDVHRAMAHLEGALEQARSAVGENGGGAA
ncbi:putrescine aminotransferase [Streptomyces sp. Amel2xB2]|uniref:aspartate aminotransferase family protein n=1 Tax=Streptomyces sp. Amel2xB2 TaxID=1305829 RepID=UPI000DBF4865|nr:aminotransferase class III-fold pyridoxal phosphate-dependent enzyme [Streptomyces sp. Amel2xB2]RAJ67180.1 putrescine aminotransferase [Streptomyces sp. Amel2xB2]